MFVAIFLMSGLELRFFVRCDILSIRNVKSRFSASLRFFNSDHWSCDLVSLRRCVYIELEIAILVNRCDFSMNGKVAILVRCTIVSI